jgi:hypothetical protein
MPSDVLYLLEAQFLYMMIIGTRMPSQIVDLKEDRMEEGPVELHQRVVKKISKLTKSSRFVCYCYLQILGFHFDYKSFRCNMLKLSF